MPGARNFCKGIFLDTASAQRESVIWTSHLGISQAQLSKYELGQSAPPLGVLVALGEVAGDQCRISYRKKQNP